MIAYCLSYLSTTLMKQHDQGDYRRVIWSLQFQRIRVYDPRVKEQDSGQAVKYSAS